MSCGGLASEVDKDLNGVNYWPKNDQNLFLKMNKTEYEIHGSYQTIKREGNVILSFDGIWFWTAYIYISIRLLICLNTDINMKNSPSV